MNKSNKRRKTLVFYWSKDDNKSYIFNKKCRNKDYIFFQMIKFELKFNLNVQNVHEIILYCMEKVNQEIEKKGRYPLRNCLFKIANVSPPPLPPVNLLEFRLE